MHKTERGVTYDERVGCIAVYYGDMINCLSEITNDEKLIYYCSAKNIDGKWVMDPEKKKAAEIIYQLNLSVEFLVKEKEWGW